MVNECVKTLQTVEQSQLLQVQVVVLTHLPLQVLTAEIHHTPHLNENTFTLLQIKAVIHYKLFQTSKDLNVLNRKCLVSYLQEVGSFQHIVNVTSIQWQLSTVQEVHYSVQTDVGHPNQLHLQTGR